MTCQFDSETGVFSYVSTPQHLIRVPVRLFSTRIESGTDLLRRAAASNEAIGLAYARLAIARLLRFSERREDKKILLSPTSLKRTRSQIQASNRSKDFLPVVNVLLNLNIDGKENKKQIASTVRKG